MGKGLHGVLLGSLFSLCNLQGAFAINVKYGDVAVVGTGVPHDARVIGLLFSTSTIILPLLCIALLAIFMYLMRKNTVRWVHQATIGAWVLILFVLIRGVWITNIPETCTRNTYTYGGDGSDVHVVPHVYAANLYPVGDENERTDIATLPNRAPSKRVVGKSSSPDSVRIPECENYMYLALVVGFALHMLSAYMIIKKHDGSFSRADTASENTPDSV